MTNDLLKFYDNKWTRSLIQLVPYGIGSAVDVFVKDAIDNIRTDRLRTFFNQLETGEITLTDEVIKSEDFLHNYFSTIRIVLNTKRREKIELFGNLFRHSVNNSSLLLGDTYEYYLKILDELTFQEIEILFILNNLELKTNPSNNQRNSKLNANKNIWQEFREIMMNKFQIDSNSLDDILIRIERTGCLYLPRISANDLRPYAAMTTEIFKKLKESIKNNQPPT